MFQILILLSRWGYSAADLDPFYSFLKEVLVDNGRIDSTCQIGRNFTFFTTTN